MARILTQDGRKNVCGPRIRALRRQRKLSQEELAAQLQLLGLDSERGVIKRIENGERYVNDLELQIIARFFQVSYQYLIDGI